MACKCDTCSHNSLLLRAGWIIWHIPCIKLFLNLRVKLILHTNNGVTSPAPRSPAGVRCQREHGVRDPALQCVPVCHGEERSHPGVPPERWRRGVAHGGSLLRSPWPVGWGPGPRRGELRLATTVIVIIFWCSLGNQAQRNSGSFGSRINWRLLMGDLW